MPVSNDEDGRSVCRPKKHTYIIIYFLKGVNSSMQKENVNMATMSGDKLETKPVILLERIGSTTFEVAVHFSERSCETLDDKLIRLIEREVKDIA